MDDGILLLQMAFAIVGDTADWDNMSSGARFEEIRRNYEKLEKLIEGVPVEESIN